MKLLFSALLGGFQAEWRQLSRSRLLIALTVIQAVTFLFLVSLFALTGSFAPTALVVEDHGRYAQDFIARLAAAHHSLDLRPMDQQAALAALHQGSLVAIITIPDGFSDAIAHGKDTSIQVIVDNVNIDMTEDIQEALPSAIVAFGKQVHFPGIHVNVTERDLIGHDTGFIEYLVVSGLALDAFVIASILSAMVVAREFEAGTVRLLAVAPVHPAIPILGRVAATAAVAALAMLFPVALAIWGYHITPLHPFAMIGAILLCIVIFSCAGVALGALVRRTLPVASLVFGLSLPLYLCSGSLRPQRFAGELIWYIAHISPVYYAVGILEQAFHGLQVTPESIATDFMALIGWAAAMLVLSGALLGMAVQEKNATWYARERRERVPWRRRLALYGNRLWWRRHIVLDRSHPVLLVALLLLVVGLGLGTWWNLSTQMQRQQQVERQIAVQQEQDTLLRNYTNLISSLLIHDNLLYTSRDSGARAIANLTTQRTLRRLDARHKALLIRFLYGTNLIKKDFRIIDLRGVDLRDVDLSHVNLLNVDLTGVNCGRADLRGSNLAGANLIATNLSNANLAGADLSRSNMRDTNMSGANLTGANMQYAQISAGQLWKAASLWGAILPDGSSPPSGLDTV